MRDWTGSEIRSMADRLRRARLNAGFLRATEAVRKFGWNYSRYMNYENGERAIPPKQAMLFATAYHVTVDYIYFGETLILNKTKGINALIPHAVRRIPLLSLQNKKDFQHIASGLEPMAAVALPVSDEDNLPERAVFIQIADRSMFNPNERVSFEPGDRVLIDLDASPKPSEFVVALAPGEETALFRVYREIERLPGGAIVFDLVPLNPNFRTIRVAGDGAIVGVCRQLHRVQDL